MRYIIFGAGAIGSTIGGMLTEAGADTVLISRGEHFEAVKRDGLRLRTPRFDRTIRTRVVSSPYELQFSANDVVVLTMKSQDTTPALEALEAAGGHDAAIVCAQNGVDNERIAARRFKNVYGMLVALSATFETPGEVIAFGEPVPGVLDIGMYPTGTNQTCEAVARDFTAAGVVSRAVDDVMPFKYQKLLTNLNNGVEAIAGRSEQVTELSKKVRSEGELALAAAGIKVSTTVEYRNWVNTHYSMGQVQGVPRSGNSTWQSMVRGLSRLETDYLNGEIMLLGRLHGVPTPLNAAVRALSQEMATKNELPGSRSVADIYQWADARC